MSTIMNTAYSSFATVGKVETYVKSIFSVIISIIIIIVGYYLYRNATSYDKASGIVTKVITKKLVNFSNGKSNTVEYAYDILVSYNANNKAYTSRTLYNTNASLSVGSPINVYYLTSSPETIVTGETSKKWIGIAFLVIGPLLLISTIVNLYLVQSYKQYAAFEGVGDTANLIKTIF